MGEAVGRVGPTFPTGGFWEGSQEGESGEKESKLKSWSQEYQANVEGQSRQALRIWVRQTASGAMGMYSVGE